MNTDLTSNYIKTRSVVIIKQGLILYWSGKIQWIYDLTRNAFVDGFTNISNDLLVFDSYDSLLKKNLKSVLNKFAHGGVKQLSNSNTIAAFERSSIGNYYHFIFDELVDLLLLDKYARGKGEPIDNICLLDTSFFKEPLLRVSGLLKEKSRKVVYLDVSNKMASDDVLISRITNYITFANSKRHSNKFENLLRLKEKVEILQEAFAPRLAEIRKRTTSHYPKKIFIERGVTGNQSCFRKIYAADQAIHFKSIPFQEASYEMKISLCLGKSRSFLNPSQLIFHNDLAANGFRIVHMESLSIEEQILLFSSADVIAGVHGAAFSNLLFAKPSANII